MRIMYDNSLILGRYLILLFVISGLVISSILFHWESAHVFRRVGALETLASVHSDIESDMKNIVQEIKLLHQRMDGIEKELQSWKSQRQQERIDQTR